jgi:hypothetical protein
MAFENGKLGKKPGNKWVKVVTFKLHFNVKTLEQTDERLDD